MRTETELKTGTHRVTVVIRGISEARNKNSVGEVHLSLLKILNSTDGLADANLIRGQEINISDGTKTFIFSYAINLELGSMNKAKTTMTLSVREYVHGIPHKNSGCLLQSVVQIVRELSAR